MESNAQRPETQHTETHRTATRSKETIPEVVEASVRGEDEPMEREHPSSPGALVWFTYPLLLIVVMAIAAIVMTVML